MFQALGRVNHEQSPGNIQLLIDNSQTIYLGAAVKSVAGYIQPATTTGKVLGVVVGIVDANGRPLTTEFAKTTYTGTFTNGQFGTQSYVSSSTNTTVDKIKVLVNMDPNTIFFNDTQGNLAQSMLFGFFFILTATNAGQLANYVGNGAGQFQLVKLDPLRTGIATQGGFKLAYSQLDAYNVS